MHTNPNSFKHVPPCAQVLYEHLSISAKKRRRKTQKVSQQLEVEFIFQIIIIIITRGHSKEMHTHAKEAEVSPVKFL